MESAAFRAIVGEPKFTKGKQPVGVIFDSSPELGFRGYLEIKGGTSELSTTYQLRLETYRAVTESQPFIIQTTRPINPAFQKWLDFWGVKVAKPARLTPGANNR
jgi:hypothetical protein